MDSIEQSKGKIKIYLFIKMKFTCLNNRILVQPEENNEKQTVSGIILLKENEKPLTGIVVVGNKEVKKGDKIIFSKFGYDEVKIDGKLYYVVSDFNLLGIFK